MVVERLVNTFFFPGRSLMSREIPCPRAAILPEVWQDWDGDGNWDTWLYRVGPDRQGECSVEYRVDLSGDGRPDWRFIRRYGEYEQARSKIVTRRGF